MAGDLYTKEEFINDVNLGCLMDYDGVGYYVKDGEVTKDYVLPSHVGTEQFDDTCTHVMWYNR